MRAEGAKEEKKHGQAEHVTYIMSKLQRLQLWGDEVDGVERRKMISF